MSLPRSNDIPQDIKKERLFLFFNSQKKNGNERNRVQKQTLSPHNIHIQTFFLNLLSSLQILANFLHTTITFSPRSLVGRKSKILHTMFPGIISMFILALFFFFLYIFYKAEGVEMLKKDNYLASLERGLSKISKIFQFTFLQAIVFPLLSSLFF